jgi:hypothetical protein
MTANRDNAQDNNHSSFFSGVTSINVARSFVHCSSVIGLSLMMYLPSVWSTCQASRQRFGSLFFSQKICAVTSGGSRGFSQLTASGSAMLDHCQSVGSLANSASI